MPKKTKSTIKNNEKNMEKSIWPDWPKNKLFFVLLAILMVYSVVYLAFAIEARIKENDQIGKAPHERDTITISGQGEALGAPDVAVVNVGMIAEGATVVAAQSDNTEKMNKLIQSFKEMGIDSKDLQTVDYTIYPKYDYNEGRSDIVGYRVSQSVEVTIRDLSKISLALSAAGEAGANQVSGVSFEIDDPDELKQQARLEALADAQNKAENIAAALGVDLGQVVGFSESTATPYAGRQAFAEGLGGAGEAPQIETGTLDITSNVTVTFEIN